MKYQEIFEKIQKGFCGLTKFKVRNNTLEIITAFSTVNNKFISVFITFLEDKIVLTDNGWLHQNYYNTPTIEESEDLIKRVTLFYMQTYNIKVTEDSDTVFYYYKSTMNYDQIPSLVFDMANFLVGVINASCIPYIDEKEIKERETFKKDVNDFLSINYADLVKFRSPLQDYPTIKFNAIITSKSNLFIITYVTGSSNSIFDNDLRKSIVNFEFAMRSKYIKQIKERITIFNDSSEGYNPNKSESILELLSEKTTKEPIKWSKREKILELI